MPATARRGEVIGVAIIIRHPMETGFRYDAMGRRTPRNVINELMCTCNGVEVFRARLSSGIAANPYLHFYTRAVESGEFVFRWVDDSGARGEASARLTVTD